MHHAEAEGVHEVWLGGAEAKAIKLSERQLIEPDMIPIQGEVMGRYEQFDRVERGITYWKSW